MVPRKGWEKVFLIQAHLRCHSKKLFGLNKVRDSEKAGYCEGLPKSRPKVFRWLWPTENGCRPQSLASANSGRSKPAMGEKGERPVVKTSRGILVGNTFGSPERGGLQAGP